MLLDHTKIERDMGFQNEVFVEPLVSADTVVHNPRGADIDEFASFKL